MRVRCDGVSDAAYVYFCEAPGQWAFMVATEPEIPWGMINLDFDSEHHLIGIEVLPASYFPAIITASTIRVTYDRSLDAARVYFREFGVGEVTYTYAVQPEESDVVDPEPETPVDVINLNFDSRNCLMGVEVLSASRQLPAEVLASAERI